MTDDEVNYQNMAVQVRDVLKKQRPTWEKAYKKLLPDYLSLDTSLGALDDKTGLRSTIGSKGYTAAKDLAEVGVLDAAMPIVQGLKSLYLDGGHAELGKAAGYTRSALDDLRGRLQVAALEGIYNVALPLATELEGELVTADQLQTLHERTALYKPMLDAPRAQTATGSDLREAAVQHLGEVRTAIGRLDVRVPNLQATMPELVAAYRKARIIVDGGHGPKPDASKA